MLFRPSRPKSLPIEPPKGAAEHNRDSRGKAVLFNTDRCCTSREIDEPGSATATPVNARDGYRLWAPSYSDETAVSFLEDRLVSQLTPSLAGKRLLDAGCGTGRRLRNSGAAAAIGLEPSSEMVAAGTASEGPLTDAEIILGDVRSMSFPDRSFDIVWCRLVIGHLPEIEQAYAELGRVADEGATVVVSDFHPAAYEAGHRRTFRAGPTVFELEHYVHDAEQHIGAAQAAGLSALQVREAAVGEEVRRFYEDAGRGSVYPAHIGLPIVLALSFRREV